MTATLPYMTLQVDLQPTLVSVCTAAGAGSNQRGSAEDSESSGEGLGGFWCRAGQVQQGSGEGSGEGLRSFRRSASQQASDRLVKNQTLRLLGIPPKLMLY